MRVTVILMLSLLISATTPLVAIPLLRRAGILDVPNDRSLHAVPSVRGIGVVSLITVVAAAVTCLLLRLDQAIPVALALGGSVLAAFLGLADDVVGLQVRPRLLAQCFIALSLGSVGIILTEETWLWLPVAVLIIVGYTNVANFMDGVNGISCLHGLVAGAYFIILGALLDQPWLVGTATVLFATHGGLLPWNARGRAFLGDVGSYLLGSLVATCAFGILLRGGSVLQASAPMLVYLADTVTTLLVRVRRRLKITEAHRSHVYQRLVLAGLTHLQSALVVTSVSAVCSIVTLAAYEGWLPLIFAVTLIGIVLVGYLVLPLRFGRRTARAIS